MRRYFPHILSFLVGYISLSQEILWVRVYGFINHSLPQAFGMVVVCYLVGIAFGSVLGKQLCRSAKGLWAASGWVMLLSLAGDAACFGLPLTHAFRDPEVHLFVLPLLITLTALGKAVLFPVAHHLGTTTQAGRVGASMSMVYFSNIAGSTLGPLATGLVLLSFLTTQQCIFLLLALSGAAAAFCFFSDRLSRAGSREPKSGISGLGAVGALVLSAAAACGLVLVRESLFYRLGDARDEPGPRKVFETRNGVVSLYGEVSGKPHSDDAVLGGNVYDGRTNLDPARNTNFIDRVIILPAVQPRPRRVLLVGMSIGTWLTLLGSFPGVESIDVVEINEGYVQAIEGYPEQRRTLQDPRVHLFIDDGNRWLKAHPDSRYDLVVMNTTYYWRNFCSNLLSREFLHDVSGHMNPGAVLTYNTTDEPDALKTACATFKYARMRRNFVIASDHDFSADLHSQESFERILGLKLEGERMFADADKGRLRGFLAEPLVPVERKEAEAGRPLEVITQDNMLTEYRRGLPLFTPVATHLWRKAKDRLAAIGREHGAFRVSVLLSRTNLGGYEPLILVPNRDHGAAVVLIHYADASHVRIGFFQTGIVHTFTAPIETDYGKPHTATLALGAFLPAPDSPEYQGWPAERAGDLARKVILSWDGKRVFTYDSDFGVHGDWYAPCVGRNGVVEGISGPRFTGTVISQGRDPLRALLRDSD